MSESEKERLETLEKYKKYSNPSLARLFKITGSDRIEWRSRGSIIRDTKGKKLIDCLGGYGVFNLGHSHPKVIKAVREQLRRMPLSSKALLNKPLADLSELLAKVTPGDLQYSFIANSGAEAVEGALKLARAYSGKPKIISALNSFHGKTLGALSCSGRDIYKKPFKPLLADFVQVPFGKIKALEKEMTEDTAAVILEVIQGEGGIIIPPPDYLPQVRRLCNKKGVILILDEIQTGLGRCGMMFACEHLQVTPDIMTLAKSLGGGVMPIGAFIAKPSLWKPFLDNPLIHTSTFGGNPLACAAAIATIKTIKEENLPQRAKESGTYLLSRLSSLHQRYPEVIAQVRGMGLLIGIELTKEGLGGVILPEMLKRGVLIAYTLNNPKVIRFEPPLIITLEQINLILKAFEESLEVAKGIVGRMD